MGVYLNSKNAYTMYKKESLQPYFVDKSQMLEELFPLIKNGNNQICITRPRRFGKTVMANMISSFFSKGCDADDVFRDLYISKCKDCCHYMNQYSVIHIAFNKLPKRCTSYQEYIDRIERILIQDLQSEYPDFKINASDAVWDVLLSIYSLDDTAQFIFVLDEWDFIFHQDFVSDTDKKAYLSFLRDLLKDMPYVIFTYMTGILPIAKYSSGSELNMFAEFTMAKTPAFSNYFGFTEDEVDMLYRRYVKLCDKPCVTQEGLRIWYNGYHTAAGARVYNPRSVVLSLLYNNLGNYWTSAGPYDEIYYYIANNVDDVRDDLALMVSGVAVPAKIQEYAATSMNLQMKDEIFSAMVVYGFISYENGKVSIPNQELMERFADMLQKEPSLGICIPSCERI